MRQREHEEKLIARLLRKKDKVEALSWLEGIHASSNRNLAEWTTAESIARIRGLYGSGAREVWAVQFDRNLPYESINTLIVTLPDDAAERAKVFEWVREQAMVQGFEETEPDAGQRHLRVWFD
jgi:hypothetical protein